MRGDAPMTPDHPTVQVCCFGYFRAGIGRSKWEGLNTGCDEKAPRLLSMQPFGWTPWCSNDAVLVPCFDVGEA